MPKVRLSAVFIPFLALTISACSMSARYNAIGMKQGEGPPALQKMAREAVMGDKTALMHLGFAREVGGLGLSKDIKLAKRLYHLAATDSGGSLYAYAVPVGDGEFSDHRTSSDYSPFVPGLSEAKERLKALKQREQSAK